MWSFKSAFQQTHQNSHAFFYTHYIYAPVLPGNYYLLLENGYDIRAILFQKTQESKIVKYIATIIATATAGYADQSNIVSP